MTSVDISRLRKILDRQYEKYARPDFIHTDPVLRIHEYAQKEDQEIAGLFSAIFAWGKRTIILNKTADLLNRMDYAPHAFIMDTDARKFKALRGFVHRTFLEADVKSFVLGLQHIYTHAGGLEKVFCGNYLSTEEIHALQFQENYPVKTWAGIQYFRNIMLSVPGFTARTSKHIPNPMAGTSAKRLHMYLRWMVRKDSVDIGIWKKIKPSELMCPLDVHTGRVSRALGLLHRPQDDRKAVEELSASLRLLCPEDPVKYDLALFGMGEEGVY